MKTLLASVSALTLATSGALAQDIFDLGEITVFSNQSGEEAELDRTGATVEVITEEELRNAPETKLADVLAKLPGVTASANGGLGGATTLRVRGLDGKYIKVLVNGIDVTDPSRTQIQFNWSELTTSAISRIELLKGSSSSVYGSSAIGGVVNITTDRPNAPGVSGDVWGEIGSFDTYRAGLTVNNQGDRGGLSFSLNRVQTDGFSATTAGDEPDGFDATQLSFSGDIQATDTLTLGLSALYVDSEGQFDEFGGDGTPPFDEYNTAETRALRGWAELLTGAVTHTFALSTYQNDRLSTSNGWDTEFDGTRDRAEYKGVYDASDRASYTFGADWQEESYDSGADSGSRTNTGLFGEALFAASNAADLALSLRYDDYSDFGDNLSGRAALAYRLDQGTILRAVASTGFRAPSLYELNNTLYGNPDLQPEESVSLELGVEQQLGGGSFVKATAFYTEIDGLIQFVTLTSWPDPFTGEYQQVPGTSTSQGIELSGAWAVNERVTLLGNYTYTDAVDANGAPLLRVPEHNLLIGLEAMITDRLTGTISANYVSDRPEEWGTPMPAYTVVDADFDYAVNDRVDVYLRVENLFDEDYQTAAGFSTSPRAFYAGVRAAF